MTTIIRGHTGQSTYVDVLKHVLTTGRERSARGLPTLDAGMTIIEIASPWHALPLGVRPRLSTRVAAAEAIQLIGGFHAPDLMLRASPRFADFIEPNGRFHGAYGQRVGRQVTAAITKLNKDRGTRQAIISLWDPLLDNQPGKKDYPCTVALRFFVDDERLDLDVIMRSNDVWLGLPYDMFQFTQLQLTVARSMRVAVGRYRHTTWSLHLYRDDVTDAKRVVAEYHPGKMSEQFQPDGIGLYSVPYTDLMMRAVGIAGAYNCLPTDVTDSERWYREQLTPRESATQLG